MKKLKIFTLSLLFLLIWGFNANTQNFEHINFANEQLQSRGEFYFSFDIGHIEDKHSLMSELTRIISIDGYKNEKVFAYANAEEFNQFLTYNLNFEPVFDYYNQTKALTMATTVAQMANWDRYPTFAVYAQMMNNFATDYPNLTRLDTIGFSVNGYPILCLVISSNVNVPADKPKFWWSSTMHGDELAGYILLLRLADYLLSNYGTNTQVTNLVDNIYIYIDPLANPDGSYYNSAGYTNIENSRRNNANDFDLNRNYPPIIGTGQTIQVETQSAMTYASQQGFTMSANGHGGIELINYPWDFWTSSQNPHPDDNWWQYVSYLYAGLAQANSPAGYFTGQGDGVTHGGDWYVVAGGRQDFMNYYRNIREVTLEWSTTKKLGVEYLNAYWNYNRQALLDYTQQVLYGFRGVITDACTGDPIHGVKVEILDHDKDNSHVYSFSPVGNYHRLIYQGNYNVKFSLDGYQDFVTNLSVFNNQSTRLDVTMFPIGVAVPDFIASETDLFEAGTVSFTNNTSIPATSYIWSFPGGSPASFSGENPPAITYNDAGFFDVTLGIMSMDCEIDITKNEYIKVYAPVEPVADFVADNTVISAGNSVIFSDLSANIPNQWHWQFEGGVPSVSSQQNPVVTYNYPGTYNVSLAVANDYGQAELTKENYIQVGLPNVCNAGSTNSANLHITNFSLNTINNNSINTLYSDFTGIQTNLLIGANYSFSVNASNSYDYNHCKIWIDWNSDGVFSEVDELIYDSGIGNANSFTGNFTVPSGIVPTTVRLRIRLHYNRAGYGPNATPCGNSTYGEVEDYGIVILIPEIPPVAGFSATSPETCESIVQFVDNSLYADTWLWDFGDGNTSDSQNPEHIYAQSGTYTINLYVTNAYGDDVHTEIAYVVIDIPDKPETSGDQSCEPGELTLTAFGNGILKWFDQEIDGNLIHTGNSLTDFFTEPTTYYVESFIQNIDSYNVGNDNSSSSGNNHTNNDYYINFSVFSNLYLKSIEVNANGAGNRIIQLWSAANVLIEEKTVFVPAGISRLDIDFEISTGNYSLRCGTANPNLFRSNAGVSYPYFIENIISITGSNAGQGFYYYFYDWEIEVRKECSSIREPVTANILETPEISLGDDITQCEGTVVLDAGDGFTFYTWNGVEGIQTFEVSSSQIVTLEVEDSNGCSATDEIDVTIHTNPEISLGDDITQCGGTVVLDAGDGFTFYTWNGVEGIQTFEVTSSQIVTLVVEDTNGCSETDDISIIIYPEMFVQVEVINETYPGAANGQAEIIISGGLEPFDIEWESGSNDQIIFNLESGNYDFTVTDANNCTYEGMAYVGVGDMYPPVADFEADLLTGCDVLQVQFTDLSQNDILEWFWDFGDGNTSYEQNPQHTYVTPGIYSVVLTVLNSIGSDMKEITDYITIGETPQISLMMEEESAPGASDGVVSVNVTANFEYTLIWNTDEVTESIVGLSAGLYCVTVSNAFSSCQTSDCIELTTAQLNLEPVADIIVSNVAGCEPLNVQFTDNSTNEPNNWLWDFGDGNTSEEQNPIHVYNIHGTYSVSLSVSNEFGNDYVVYENLITVYEKPLLSFEVINASSGDSNDGEIILSIIGGTAPYQIFWSNGINNSIQITGLNPDFYSVAVVDSNGCMATGAVQVSISTDLISSDIETISIFPNPAEDFVYIISENVLHNIQIIDASGRLISEFYPKSDNYSIDIGNYAEGIYLIKIIDPQGLYIKNLLIAR